MITNNTPVSVYIAFLPDKYNSFSLDQYSIIFQQWIVSTLLFKPILPRAFILCPESKVKDKEKTNKILKILIEFMSKYPCGSSYYTDGISITGGNSKFYLDFVLRTEQESGNFLDLKKLPGSKFYFGKTEEELNKNLLVSLDSLIFKDFQIQHIPEDTIIFIDRIPTEIPFQGAREIVLNEFSNKFEEIYETTKKEFETIFNSNNQNVENKKEIALGHWALWIYEKDVDKELQAIFEKINEKK